MSFTKKDYRIQVKVRNNYLLEAIELAGCRSILSAAKAAGLSPAVVYEVANLTRSPKTKLGKWRPSVIRLAESLNCLPEDIIPPQHHDAELATNKGEMLVSLEELTSLSDLRYLTVQGPEAELEQAETKKEITERLTAALGTLKPRERKLITHYYGLTGEEKISYTELGKIHGISIERTRQVIAHGLHKMQRPSRGLLEYGHIHIKVAKKGKTNVSSVDNPAASFLHSLKGD